MNYKKLSAKNLCISIANKTFEECLEITKQAELVELRLDLLELNFEQLKELFKLDTKIIITIRDGEILNENANSFLKNIVDLGADFIDIELDVKNEYCTDLINYTKEQNCKFILSYHNFENSPSIVNLQKIIDTANTYNPDYVKLALQVKSKTDVARILSLYENNDKIIAFGMGEVGRISRVASLYLGADFTYVSTEEGNETAQGQLSIEQMKTIFGII